MSAQQQVHANVAARGYLDGYDDDQIIGRQVAKLTEEAGELHDCVDYATGPNPLWFGWSQMKTMQRANGRRARSIFDADWNGVSISFDAEALASEAADLLVVLFTLAETLGVDLVQLAIDKSAADVERGVR